MQCCVLGSSNLSKRKKSSDHYVGMGNNVASWMGRGAGLSSEESENEMPPLFPAATSNPDHYKGSDSAMTYHRNEMHEHPAARSDTDSTMASSPKNENTLVQRNAPGLQREEMWASFAYFLSLFKNAYEWYQQKAGYLANSLLAFVGLSIVAIIYTYQLDESFCFAIRALHAIFTFCLPVMSSWNCFVKHLRTIVPATGKHDGESETLTIRNGLVSAVAENECENLEDVRTDENNWPEQVQVESEASSGNQRQTEPPVNEIMPPTLTFSENKVIHEHLGAIPDSRSPTIEAEDACSSKPPTYWSPTSETSSRCSKQDDNASAEPLLPFVATDKKVATEHHGATPQLNPTELSQMNGCHPNDSVNATLEKLPLSLPSADLQNLGSWAIPTIAISILVMNFASVIYFICYSRDVIIILNLVNDILGVYPWIKRKLADKLASLRNLVSNHCEWLADRILWAELKLLASGDEPSFHVSQHLVFSDVLLSLLCVVFSSQNPVPFVINILNFFYKLAMLVYRIFPHEEYKKATTEYCRQNYWLPLKSSIMVIWENLLEMWSRIHWADIKSRITSPFRKFWEYVHVPTDRERNFLSPV
ncbi:uncharacterized protein LOC135948291 [Cloeon dipterum]|uniref:uncharacterized protein LOC135948291 n=1 Tax=Cloeon dipterum TaxID=197152 RepID=UPI0032207214